MRVTNNMIMKNASSNINSTKEVVNTRNTQMTTQKKISRPSDDPVIAVRSLRLSTTLSQVNQYYAKNIPDASSWLDVTETALLNMSYIVQDCRTLAVTGSTDSYSEEDRNTLVTQLKQLQSQLYAEGNSDYAGRTVFTGYRTNCNLTFTENEKETKYRIDQSFSVEDALESCRYYSGSVTVPTTESELSLNTMSDIEENDYYRLRLSYDEIDSLDSLSIKFPSTQTVTNPDGSTSTETVYSSITYTAVVSTDDKQMNYDDTGAITPTTDGTLPTAYATTQPNIKVYETAADWAADNKTDPATGDVYEGFPDGKKIVGDDDIVIIRETGEVIFGNNVASVMKENNATVEVEYDKTGFDEGELRPEYYYNCKKMKDPDVVDTKLPIEYTKYDAEGKTENYDIEYTVASGQTLAVNTEASNVFDMSLYRDLSEMITAVENQIAAHDKVDTITSMMSMSQYASDDDQALLSDWLAAAKKEADYADDNMQKLFSTEIGKIDEYYASINLEITNLGCKVDSLTLTKTRVGDQQETVQELQSENDDLDLSQIIIDYTAAYTAYQASLTAAGKLGDVTLLNYL